MSIGENVKQIRQEQRYTQTEIARRCGVTPAAISGLEHGDFTPSTSLLARLAKALDVTADELLKEPVPLADASETGPKPPQYITPAPGIEGEFGLPPTLEHDIDAAFARLVEDLRVAGLGSEEVLDACTQWRAHVKALAGGKS